MKISYLLLAFAALVSAPLLPIGDSLVSLARAADCVANNNLSANAQSYIGRCRRGGINSEFPREMYGMTLGDIKKGSTANHKKAWKLLNDKRFEK